MQILIRLPNWLGDMIMSVAFVKETIRRYPDARIGLIVKKGLEPLLDYFPPVQQRFVFSKAEYKGLRGNLRFGKMIRREFRPDLFFSLPDSFSAAAMGWGTGAKQRIGYRNEMRSVLLTRSYTKSPAAHRVEQYLGLLEQFTGRPCPSPDVSLTAGSAAPGNSVVLNINSEASSRRLPLAKAVSLLNALRNATDRKIVLVGGKSDAPFVTEVLQQAASQEGITNMAGQTNLLQLSALLQQAAAVLSTDSGPAHLANALDIPLVVLFGAGNENNTGPYNKENSAVIRLGQLPCEPCVSNTCKIYGVPQCLERLNDQEIISRLLSMMRQ